MVSVIALRTLKIAASGMAAEVEARRMISEKIDAGAVRPCHLTMS
jgi:hypothetical protein